MKVVLPVMGVVLAGIASVPSGAQPAMTCVYVAVGAQVSRYCKEQQGGATCADEDRVVDPEIDAPTVEAAVMVCVPEIVEIPEVTPTPTIPPVSP